MIDRLRFWLYCVRFTPCLVRDLRALLGVWVYHRRRALWGGYCRQRTGQG
jgi:hypothetical protein